MAEITISIVMPVFNTGGYLTEAVASVLMQEMPGDAAFELLIVDDASTDVETLSILERLKGSDPRICVIDNERKKGASGARNTGVLHAIGTWIAFLDSDDYYLPESLINRMRVVAAHPEIEWVAGLLVLLRDDELETGPLAKRSPNLYALIGADYEAKRPTRLQRPVAALAVNCFIQPPAVLIRRDLIVRKGLFEESLRRAEDYHLWFRCAIDTDLWIVPEDVFVYRVRPGSLTTGRTPLYQHEDELVDLLLADRAFDPHRTSLLKVFDRVMADYCYFHRKERNKAMARRWAASWIKRRPFLIAAWKQGLATFLGR